MDDVWHGKSADLLPHGLIQVLLDFVGEFGTLAQADIRVDG